MTEKVPLYNKISSPGPSPQNINHSQTAFETSDGDWNSES